MSDSNLVGVYYEREVEWGVAPQTINYKQLRYATSSLNFSISSLVSDEISDDRQITDVVNTGGEAAGDVEGRLSFDNFRDILEGALFSTWEHKLKIDSSNVMTLASGEITFTEDVGLVAGSLIKFESGLFAGEVKEVTAYSANVASISGVEAGSIPSNLEAYVVGVEYDDTDVVIDTAVDVKSITLSSVLGLDLKLGDWVGIKGKGSDDGFYRVSAVDSAKLVLTYDEKADDVPSSDVPSGKARVYFGSVLRNGTERHSFNILQKYDSHTPSTLEAYSGCMINTFELEMETNSAISISLNIQGKDVADKTGTVYDYVDAPLESIMNTSNNVGSLRIAQQKVDKPDWVQSLSFEIDNNITQIPAITQRGAAFLGVGTFSCSGSVNFLYGSNTVTQAVYGDVESSISFITNEVRNKRKYLFDMPRVKYSSIEKDNEGQDTQIDIDLDYQAIKNKFGFTIQLIKFYYN